MIGLVALQIQVNQIILTITQSAVFYMLYLLVDDHCADDQDDRH